jgi:hypothetical protein
MRTFLAHRDICAIFGKRLAPIASSLAAIIRAKELGFGCRHRSVEPPAAPTLAAADEEVAGSEHPVLPDCLSFSDFSILSLRIYCQGTRIISPG